VQAKDDGPQPARPEQGDEEDEDKLVEEPEFKFKPQKEKAILDGPSLPGEWQCARKLLLKIAKDLMNKQSAELSEMAQATAIARAEAGQDAKSQAPAAAPGAAQPASIARQVQKPTMSEVLREFLTTNTSLHVMVPGIVILALIALVIPVTSAACERGFSTLKRIKTRLRSRLKADTLDNCICVSEEAPGLNLFDLTRAIEAFFTSKQRRVAVNAA